MVKGKVALVTGGGSGMGRSTCRALAREGAKVVAADINVAGAEETISSLFGEGHMSLRMDISSKESVEAGMKAITARYQVPPRICINCAAVAVRQSVLDSTDDAYEKMAAVNIKGTIDVTKANCRELVEAQLSGSIVTIASVAVNGLEDWSLYSATKGAVTSYTMTVAKEMGRHGIRCNIIHPGPINTPMLQLADINATKEIVGGQTINRIGEPEEVAEANLFLASEKSSYITGTCLYVSGGLK